MDEVIPHELVFGSPDLRREMIGVEPPGGLQGHADETLEVAVTIREP